MSILNNEVGARRQFLTSTVALGIAAFVPSLAAASAYDDFFKAIRFDDVKQVNALLLRGMDPNTAESVRGETALIVALREKAMRVFDLLLKRRDINLNARAKNGDTALMIAAYMGNKPALLALLARGAEVNQTGWTALHYAATVGNNEIIQLLLEKHAYIDAESPNKTTPIMMAARGGHILTVKLLLDEGADLTLKNELGMTAIDFARQHGKQDIVDGLTYRLQKAGKR